MKNPFKVDKSYKNRHKILGVLYKDWELNNHEDNRRVGSIKIATETKIPILEIHQLQHLLIEKGQIVVADNDGQSMISIQQAGISAYIDQRYLKEGRKNLWDGIYDWARILIPLAALVLSIVNFISNKNINQKIKDLETKMNQVKK